MKKRIGRLNIYGTIVFVTNFIITFWHHYYHAKYIFLASLM